MLQPVAVDSKRRVEQRLEQQVVELGRREAGVTLPRFLDDDARATEAVRGRGQLQVSERPLDLVDARFASA